MYKSNNILIFIMYEYIIKINYKIIKIIVPVLLKL